MNPLVRCSITRPALRPWLLTLPVVLVGCTPTLDHNRIAAQIQTDLAEQPGLTLKAVRCPEKVAIAQDSSFICTGELEPTGTFPITVTQTDAAGTVKWEVPNSKGLLNLSMLESEFSKAIASDMGGNPPLIDCGGSYRVNQPGDRFECRVLNAPPLQQGQIQTFLTTVTVTLDPQGNVTWQQQRRQQLIARATTAGSNRANETGRSPGQSQPSQKPAAATSTTAPPPKASTPTQAVSPAAEAAPAAQTADDFLTNPGAMDGF